MFGKWKKLKEDVQMLKLKRFNDETKSILEGEAVRPIDTVDCEVCGCMIKKEKAVKGKAEIRKKKLHITNQQIMHWFVYNIGEFHEIVDHDMLYYPYYCKMCKPEKNK